MSMVAMSDAEGLTRRTVVPGIAMTRSCIDGCVTTSDGAADEGMLRSTGTPDPVKGLLGMGLTSRRNSRCAATVWPASVASTFSEYVPGCTTRVRKSLPRVAPRNTPSRLKVHV